MLFTQKRQFKIIVELDCENSIKGKEEIEETVKALGYSVLEVKHQPYTRTLKQNKSLHLLFPQIADALNSAGFDMKSDVTKVDIPWSEYTIKEYMWRPVQLALTGKKSSTKLERHEIDRIYEALMKVIGERTGLYIPFPCKEERENQAINNLRR